ncbi:MAG: hypothetical protein JXR49_16410 [Acidobacteria bacterium]|nr:hypothetical protein [Acidobacteriota bacterium]
MKNNLYRDPFTEKIAVDRRSGRDRRDRISIFPLSHFWPLRRKKGGRREADTGYVDVYDLRTWLVAVSVILLSLMDALLTQQHLIHGSARELNPIMDAVIRMGGMPAFYGTKGILTVIAVSIIMLHKEWALGRVAARICLWAYILLSMYHLYLVLVLEIV